MRRSLALLLLLPSLAVAQETAPAPAPAPKVIFQKVTTHDFERGLEFEGQLVKPRVSVISQRADGVFNPLIKLRTNFDQEMLQSADEVR